VRRLLNSKTQVRSQSTQNAVSSLSLDTAVAAHLNPWPSIKKAAKPAFQYEQVPELIPPLSAACFVFIQ